MMIFQYKFGLRRNAVIAFANWMKNSASIALCTISISGVISIPATVALQAQTKPADKFDSGHPTQSEQLLAKSVLHVFWNGSFMDREPVLFVQAHGAKDSTAKLLFVPTQIISVTSGDGLHTFDEGRDYLWSPGTNTLTLTPDSRIPFKTFAELHPRKGSSRSFGETVDGKSGLFFVEGGAAFQSLQMNVTYDHKEKWKGYVPPSASTNLRRTIARLKNKEPLHIVVLGDSISAGACASGTFGGLPYQPPFTGLVAQALRVEYGTTIALDNLSVGGMVSTLGVTVAPSVAAENPDLVIVAFGMNDASAGESPVVYSRNIHAIIDTVRKRNPDTDFILVATMTGNPEWNKADSELYTEYLNELLKLEGPGIAVANMTSLWRDMLQTKTFVDLTGNGINHPNDFGHRVYAQVILQLLQ
jgi:acyl-CoA thioesterase-1